jgi:glycogen phosphorylase
LFHISVLLNGLDPGKILVELYANGINGSASERIKMEPDSSPGRMGEQIYSIRVLSSRPAGDYTARIIPKYEDISVPLENNLILWQR